jgi:hypothetical protein
MILAITMMIPGEILDDVPTVVEFESATAPRDLI